MEQPSTASYKPPPPKYTHLIIIVAVSLLLLIIAGIFVFQKWLVKKTSCADVFPQKDGYYAIYPDGQTPVRAYCNFSEGIPWTIINLQLDNKWLSFFRTPSYQKSEKGYFYPNSCISWDAWFTLSTPQTQFAISNDCQIITKVNQVYRATGNYYGCLWWAGDNPTNQYYNGPYNFYRPEAPRKKYADNQGKCWDCKRDWWNTAPSIGAGNKHCVAYTSVQAKVDLKTKTSSITPPPSEPIPSPMNISITSVSQNLEPISFEKYTPVGDNLGNIWYIQKNNDYLCEPNSGNEVCNLMKTQTDGTFKLVGSVHDLKMGSGLLKFIPPDKLISYSAYGDHGGTWSILYSLNVATLETKKLVAFYWSGVDACNDYRLESPEKTLYVINCPQGWKSVINISKQGVFVADKNSEVAREIATNFNPPFKVDFQVEDNAGFENSANFIINGTKVSFDFIKEELK